MNSLLKKNKIILGLTTVIGTLMMLTQLSFAATTEQNAAPNAKPNAETATPPAPPVAVTPAPPPPAAPVAATPDKAKLVVDDQSDLHVQYFRRGDLSIQLRYDADNKLVGISFKNVGTRPMEIKVLSHQYVLGASDEVVIDPPKVDYIRIMHQQQTDVNLQTVADNVLKQRFGSKTLLKLPPQHNDTLAQ